MRSRRIKIPNEKSGRTMIMFISRECRLSRRVSSGFTLRLFFLLVGLIQISAAPAEDDKQTEPIEEITSYGDRSLLSFRYEMEAAENKYYDSYNILNDDDEFDVICKHGVPTASHIKRRSCKGRFEWESMTDLDKERIRYGLLPTDHSAEILRKKGMVLDKMEKLAEENPDFRESLFELTRISQEYEAEKKIRCEGRLICAGGDNPE